METRSRHSSYPAGTEEDEGVEEELSPFRGRSRSAPPNLWAAQRYGRELRRMSDEFEGSFKVSASVGCDGTGILSRLPSLDLGHVGISSFRATKFSLSCCRACWDLQF